MPDEHTALGVALDTLRNIKINAEDAYKWGEVIDPYWLKNYIGRELQKIQQIKERINEKSNYNGNRGER